MLEVATRPTAMKSHFPEIRVGYQYQNSFRAERRQEMATLRENSCKAFVSSANQLIPGKVNLTERSLLGAVSRSRLSGRRTWNDADPSPSRANTVNYSNSRSRVISREMESFLPQVAHPSPLAHYTNANVEPDKKVKTVRGTVQPSRVEAALEMVRKLKELRRENQSLGVPKDFTFANTGCIIIEDDESMWKRNRKKKMRARLQLRNDDRSNREDGKTKRAEAEQTRNTRTKEMELHRAKTTVAEVGLKWKSKAESKPTELSNRKQRAWEKWAASKPIARENARGTLCKVKYPLAEALTREGTSAEKRRGRTLQRGDWKIMKIWPRPADRIQPNILPVQMANEDIPLLRKIYEMAKFYDNAVDVCSLENDGLSTSESYSDEKLMDDEQSEGKTNSSDANSLDSFHDDDDDHHPTDEAPDSDRVDGRANENGEGDRQDRRKHVGDSASAGDNQEETAIGEDAAALDAQEADRVGDCDDETGQNSASKTGDSEIQSENEERARIQRSWLHVASGVLSAESGGT
ncbi:hypothetical protein LSH36_111g00037 [Paralvinella palmiformis]|uniref:Uncharacterized protein n=1 Tax=Paralvinella palmiformis TaxID=53620 RepID=A0AAD9JZ26_9ANNE|nr:hypothetical protein LSH36_111g00037 [Paralvinella palmiformis]